MNYPIVAVKTNDQVKLHGVLFEPKQESTAIKIHIPGTAGSFFWNDFYPDLVQSALKLGMAQLNTNTRGTGVYDMEKGLPATGAALEKFEDCLLDIDAWIELALSKGYEQIVLEGHSFGTEKIVYYMNHGQYRDKVQAVILMGFSDTYGTQQKYEQETGKSFTKEAQSLVDQGQEKQLLSDLTAFAGELPISAGTYHNFFSASSECAQTLPFRNGKKLTLLSQINVPILGVISDNDDEEYTIIPIKQAASLLESENNQAQVKIITNTDHGFTGKSEEVAATIESFLENNLACR